jgi:hypothetical protein
MRKTKSLVLAALIFFSSLVIFTSCSKAVSAPTIYVDPSQTTVWFNETSVSINVSITGAVNVSGWEFSLYYVNSILHSVTAIEGDFLISGGTSTWFWIGELNDNYNSTHGRVSLTCIQLGNTTNGVSGSGMLTTITFQPLAGGNSTLHLSDLVLADPSGNKMTPINSSDGTVRVLGTADIAITSVTPLKTVVGQGQSMKINVTIKNQGEQTATFNVTTYANTTVVDTALNISLSKGSSTIVTFTWNTTGFAYGNYTVSAYAWPVPGEANTNNNNMTGGSVLVTIPGDINGDGTVNILDAIQVSNAFLTTPSSSNWNPNADINDDNVVNILDAIILANHFLQHYP